jgi:hypothetical protein
MPLGTPYILDTVAESQPDSTLEQVTPAAALTQYAGNVVTPSQNFGIVINGQVTQCLNGVPIVTTGGVAAALTAAGAPAA